MMIFCSYKFAMKFLISLIFILIAITYTNAQGLSQYFERGPDKEYKRLRGMNLEIPCYVRNRQGECLWLHDGKVIGNIQDKYSFQRTPINGDCTIRIDNLDLALDNGNWQCQVTSPSINSPPLQSTVARVIVLVAPNKPFLQRIVRKRLAVQADRSGEVECQVDDGNPPPRIEWFIDNVNVTQNSRIEIRELEGRLQTRSYLTKTFKRSHMNATIVCQALHPTITQNDSAIIDVQYPPEVSVPQKIYVVNENSELQVECQVDANPPAYAFWRQINNNFDNVHLESTVLNIKRVTKDMNNAVFECKAENEKGQSQPAPISLDVLYEPRLLKSSQTQQTLELGASTYLFCDYEGNPKPEIFWYQINPISDLVRHRPNNAINSSIFNIYNSTYNDEGDYYCEATNYNKLEDKNNIVRSTKFSVDIFGKPNIIHDFSTLRGIKGSKTDLYQRFCSDPQATKIYWQFGSIRLDVPTFSSNDFPIDPSKNNSLHSRYHVHNLVPLERSPSPTCFQATVTISNTDIVDEREYILYVENIKGSMEGVVKLRVVSPLSAGAMIVIGLIILVMLLILTFVTLALIKKRRSNSKADEESKADAQIPMRPDDEKSDKDKDKRERHELVYANLEFTKSSESKPQKSRPQALQRQHRSNGGNTTEYAQIQFAKKADL